MSYRILIVSTLSCVGALTSLTGCDEGPTVTSLAPREDETPEFTPEIEQDNTVPVAYVPTGPDGGAAAAPAPQAGGGGGGGGARGPSRGARSAERAADALREMSTAEALAMITGARQAARAEDGDDGCARLVAGFGGIAAATGENGGFSENQIGSLCQDLPEEMQACFRDPSERTSAQQQYCTQVFGTDDIFNPTETSPIQVPPGTRMPTEQELLATRRAERLARSARRP